MSEKKKPMNLGGVKKDRSGASPKKKKKPVSEKEAESTENVFNDAYGEDDSDEILSGVPKKGGKSNYIFAVVGVLAVAVLVIAYLLFAPGKEEQPPVSENVQAPPVVEQQQTQQNPTTSQPSVGTQNFAGDTTMKQDSPLVNPEEYLTDVFGLTMQVNYTVKEISEIADFVSYEKHRGTWGGGLELHWLDVEYKGSQYVIQVPFKYYKELEDSGIIPVKMEVLSVEGPKSGQNLTVISYMCLDEEVLATIMKSQKK